MFILTRLWIYAYTDLITSRHDKKFYNKQNIYERKAHISKERHSESYFGLSLIRIFLAFEAWYHYGALICWAICFRTLSVPPIRTHGTRHDKCQQRSSTACGQCQLTHLRFQFWSSLNFDTMDRYLVIVKIWRQCSTILKISMIVN